MLIRFFRRNKLRAQVGLGLRRELLDPEFEEPLFKNSPLEHADCLPDHRRSQVLLLTPPDRISVGGSVQFRVDLYNGCGQPRFTGGDDIRAWVKGQDGNSSVAAEVKDLGNGSYVGVTVLPWAGTSLVRVSLTYAQEFLRMSVELYHRLHSMRWTTETMAFSGVKERVPCLPSAPIPGYAKTCNFTAQNGGRPWFCGHPVTRGLNCSHRSLFDNLPYTGPLPIPPALQRYVKSIVGCCTNPKKSDLRLIPNDIILKTHEEEADMSHTLPSCFTRPERESWVTMTPRGWLSHGQWVPSTCTLPKLTREKVQRCMRNRTLLLHGDSNQRKLMDYIKKEIGCTETKDTHWNAPHVCKNSELRSAVLQVSHAFPFSPGTHGNFPIANVPLPEALDMARNLTSPSHHNHHHHHHHHQPHHRLTVVLHYFLHPSTHQVHVYRSLVQAARRTVQEYLRLHPEEAQFVVRGPHALYQGNNQHVHIGDKFAGWYGAIWREEFEDLWDEVRYLDTWDLTVAAENVLGHPVHLVPEIARVLFGYICDDDDDDDDDADADAG
ncbi:NXPE family member 3-like [Babylonia areolata]|uniref:NXPE family member 3-like n=1 Tax=Babylonia areolata TaxID=304850 RepID=UPI003FD04AED